MIRTKRWDDPKETDDGTRILITRYRPRALKKEDETWDEWIPDLGPSSELHAAAYGKGRDAVAWATYRAAYFREMRQQRHHIEALARRVTAGETITLLCSSQCVREARCHRSLLAQLLTAQFEKTSSTDE